MASEGEHGPSRPVEVFAPDTGVETRVIGPSKAARRLGMFLGGVFAFALPFLILYGEPIGYTVTCEAATRVCTVETHYLFEDTSNQIPFDNIKSFTLHAQMSEGERASERRPTGSYSMTVELKGGGSVSASLVDVPERIRPKPLREVVAGKREHAVSETRRGLIDSWPIAFIFLCGLFLVAGTRWRTEVTYDPASRMLTMSQHYWPLLKHTTLRKDASKLRGVQPYTGDWKRLVVIDADGTEILVGRFWTGRIDDVTGALRDFIRRAKKG